MKDKKTAHNETTLICDFYVIFIPLIEAYYVNVFFYMG